MKPKQQSGWAETWQEKSWNVQQQQPPSNERNMKAQKFLLTEQPNISSKLEGNTKFLGLQNKHDM